MKVVTEEITKLIEELFPNQIYKEGRPRRYNKAYGYELSRELIRIIADYKSVQELNFDLDSIKMFYPDSEHDILTLLVYELYLEPTVSSSVEAELSLTALEERI